MKNYFLILLSIICLSCTAKIDRTKTTIKGSLKSVKDTTLYVSYIDNYGYRDDTIRVKDGKFVWEKPLSTPLRVLMTTIPPSSMEQTENYASFWTQAGEQKLTLDINNLPGYILNESAIDALSKSFELQVAQEVKELKEVSEKFQTVSRESSEWNDVLVEYNVISKKIAMKKMTFLESNPDSYYSAFLLYESESSLSESEREHYFELLKGEAVVSPFARRVKSDIDGDKNGKPGAKAPLFSAKDKDGNLFDLAKLVGEKYIIIDFWASWCAPCRASFPHLKDLYNKYKEKGLVVVCVGDNDSSPDEWLKAIEKDEIGEFIHVLRGWKGMDYFFDRKDFSSMYGIATLPTKILIDKNGVIVGRYGSDGEDHGEIDTKLKTIFGY